MNDRQRRPAGLVRGSWSIRPETGPANGQSQSPMHGLVRGRRPRPAGRGQEPSGRPGDLRGRFRTGPVRAGGSLPEPGTGGRLGRNRRQDGAGRHRLGPANHPNDRDRPQALTGPGGRRPGGRPGGPGRAHRAVRRRRGGSVRLLRSAGPAIAAGDSCRTGEAGRSGRCPGKIPVRRPAPRPARPGPVGGRVGAISDRRPGGRAGTPGRVPAAGGGRRGERAPYRFSCRAVRPAAGLRPRPGTGGGARVPSGSPVGPYGGRPPRPPSARPRRNPSRT